MYNSSTLVTRRLLFAVVFWLCVVVTIGYFGLGKAVPSLLRGPLVVAGILIPVLASAFNKAFRNEISRIPDATIVGFHAWRVLAGFAFLFYGGQGLLPIAFVRNAGYGDIAVAALVPLVLMLPESRSKYIGFHIFGLLDFMVAVGTGLYFTLVGNPLQENLFDFPLIVIPWFGVCLSGASHLIVLSRLLFSTNHQKDDSTSRVR